MSIHSGAKATTWDVAEFETDWQGRFIYGEALIVEERNSLQGRCCDTEIDPTEPA